MNKPTEEAIEASKRISEEAEAKRIYEEKIKPHGSRRDAMIAGAIDLPNKFVAYLVDKFKECQKDVQNQLRRQKELQKNLSDLTSLIIGTRAQGAKYLEDIEKWDEESESKER